MLNGKKIIVVLPAYNAAKTLEKTVSELDRHVVDDIQLVDDIEEHLETQEMAAAKTPPNLEAEFEEADRDSKLIKTSITTSANPAVTAPEEKEKESKT